MKGNYFFFIFGGCPSRINQPFKFPLFLFCFCYFQNVVVNVVVVIVFVIVDFVIPLVISLFLTVPPTQPQPSYSS